MGCARSRRRPLYALASIAVLAIAIGANTTVFSVFNGLFLRPLPYPDGDRLVMVYDSYPKVNLPNAGTVDSRLSRSARRRRRSRASRSSPSSRARSPARARRSACASRARRPRCSRCCALRRSSGARSRPTRRRLGNERVVVLSHGLWNTRFGARADVIGSDIRLDGDSFRVIGVMPEGFGFSEPRHRRLRAVRIHAASKRAMLRAAINSRSASAGCAPGATVEGLNAELDDDRAAQRRRRAACRPTLSRRRLHGPRRSRCATSRSAVCASARACSRRS